MRQGCVRLAEHGVQVGAVRRPANGAQEEGGGVGLPRPDVVLSLAHLPTRSARLRLLSACLPRMGREEQLSQCPKLSGAQISCQLVVEPVPTSRR